MQLRTIIKSLLSFIWLIPYAYIFSDIYFPLGFKIDPLVLKLLIYLSFVISIILIYMWLKEFKHIKDVGRIFEYVLTGNLLKVDKILKKYHPSVFNKDGLTILQFAIDQQLNKEIILYLVSRNCLASFSYSREYDLSYSLFYLASYYNDIDIDIVKYLVESGANINYIDNSKGFDGLSSLHAVILRDDPEIVDYILNCGADVEYMVADLGLNSLMLACKHINNVEIIKLLIEYGANVEEINKYGYNAILLAARYNPNPSVISLLLAAGARIKPYNIRHTESYYSEVTPLMLAASYNNVNVVKKLIQIGDDPSFRDNYGLTVLFLAAAHCNDINILKLLISTGARIEDSNDGDNNTPLMSAALLNPNAMVIKYLMNRTHNLYQENVEGLTFIDFLQQNIHLSQDEKSSLLNNSHENK